MLTLGFSGNYSNNVVLDNLLVDINGIAFTSSYIGVKTGGTEGAIVYVASNGSIQYCPWVFFGYNLIAATKILTSATVQSITYTTTAVGLFAIGSANA